MQNSAKHSLKLHKDFLSRRQGDGLSSAGKAAGPLSRNVKTIAQARHVIDALRQKVSTTVWRYNIMTKKYS